MNAPTICSLMCYKARIYLKYSNNATSQPIQIRTVPKNVVVVKSQDRQLRLKPVVQVATNQTSCTSSVGTISGAYVQQQVAAINTHTTLAITCYSTFLNSIFIKKKLYINGFFNCKFWRSRVLSTN